MYFLSLPFFFLFSLYVIIVKKIALLPYEMRKVLKYQRLLTGQIFKKQGNFHFLGDFRTAPTGLKPLKSSQELTGQKICPMVFHGKNWKLSKILKKFTGIKIFFKAKKIYEGNSVAFLNAFIAPKNFLTNKDFVFFYFLCRGCIIIRRINERVVKFEVRMG